MRVSRIFHPHTLSVESEVTLTVEATNHLVNVLRVKEQQAIVLFNGDGNEYSAHLSEVSKRKAVATIDAQLSISIESPLNIHLGQGISRGDRMDWVIQKSVELGVTEITPLITERCGIKLNQQRWQKKHEQWQKVVISACEQCGRNVLPKLNLPTTFTDWIHLSTNQLRLTLHPRAEQAFRHVSFSSAGARLLIGPEGGFSDQEIYQTEQNGFQSVQLGPRVLRTETAAISAISALQAIHGDL
jgi:16S rRNA (uracil1498-N3)-methyltransferase